MGEVVPPILTAEQVAAYRTAVHADAPSLADLLASHEALRAQRDALRQALTDLIAAHDRVWPEVKLCPEVDRARAVLAGDPQCPGCRYSGGYHAEDCPQP